MEENDKIRVSKIADNVVNLEIPELEVKNYPVWRRDKYETDGELFQRAAEFANELMRRYKSGETYCVGYRVWKDGKIRLVLRKAVESGKVLQQRILGVDDEFKPLE